MFNVKIISTRNINKGINDVIRKTSGDYSQVDTMSKQRQSGIKIIFSNRQIKINKSHTNKEYHNINLPRLSRESGEKADIF